MVASTGWGQQARSERTGVKQNTQPQSPSQPRGMFWDGKTLGPWWMMSALKYDPIPRQILYHFEGSYSFSKTTGNFESEGHRGNASLHLRKNRFTYTLTYSLDKQDQTLGIMRIAYQTLSWLTHVTVDYTSRIFSSFGFVWAEDEKAFIDKEYTFYGGVGYRVIDRPRYQLRLLAAAGHRNLERMYESHQDKAYGCYVEDTCNASLTEAVSLWQTYMLLQNVEEKDDYYWKLLTGMNAKIVEPVSLTVTYMVTYDNRPRPAGFQELFEKQDTVFMLGFTMSL